MPCSVTHRLAGTVTASSVLNQLEPGLCTVLYQRSAPWNIGVGHLGCCWHCLWRPGFCLAYYKTWNMCRGRLGCRHTYLHARWPMTVSLCWGVYLCRYFAGQHWGGMHAVMFSCLNVANAEFYSGTMLYVGCFETLYCCKIWVSNPFLLSTVAECG